MSSERSRTKAFGLLGLCIRAGKAVKGFDSAAEAVRSGKAKCLLTVSDASEKTVKEAAFICGRYSMPHFRTELTKEDTERLFGKQTAVIAVCDKGFADGFTKLFTENNAK